MRSWNILLERLQKKYNTHNTTTTPNTIQYNTMQYNIYNSPNATDAAEHDGERLEEVVGDLMFN